MSISGSGIGPSASKQSIEKTADGAKTLKPSDSKKSLETKKPSVSQSSAAGAKPVETPVDQKKPAEDKKPSAEPKPAEKSNAPVDVKPSGDPVTKLVINTKELSTAVKTGIPEPKRAASMLSEYAPMVAPKLNGLGVKDR